MLKAIPKLTTIQKKLLKYLVILITVKYVIDTFCNFVLDDVCEGIRFPKFYKRGMVFQANSRVRNIT